MKKLTLIIAIVISGMLAQAQSKGSSAIILTCEMEGEELLMAFARHLQSEGYPIDRIDKDLMSLKTDYSTYKTERAATMSINAFVFDNKITIRGTIDVTVAFSGNIKYMVEKRGIVGDVRKQAFKRMNTMVTKFNHISVTYK